MYFQQIIRRINNKTLAYIDGLCELDGIFKNETNYNKDPRLSIDVLHNTIKITYYSLIVPNVIWFGIESSICCWSSFT